MSCATGRKLMLAYYRCRLRHGRAGRCHSRVLGYSCKETRNAIPTEINARVTCRLGRRTVDPHLPAEHLSPRAARASTRSTPRRRRSRASITPQRAAKRARARREPWTSMSEDGSRAAPRARAARSAISSWPRAVGWTASGSSHGGPARSSSSASAAPWSAATARTMALAARGLGAARGRPRSAGQRAQQQPLAARRQRGGARAQRLLVGAGVPVQRARVVDADVEAGDVVGAVQARDLLGQHVARERAVARELGERQRRAPRPATAPTTASARRAPARRGRW